MDRRVPGRVELTETGAPAILTALIASWLKSARYLE
jgi:hypothetical protein